MRRVWQEVIHFIRASLETENTFLHARRQRGICGSKRLPSPSYLLPAHLFFDSRDCRYRG